jgi:hypothetical protein
MTKPNLLGQGASPATTLTQELLYSSQLASGDNAVYTVASNKAVKIGTAALCNVSASAVTISVSVVPSGGTVDGTHKVVSAYSLAAGDTISHEDGLAALKGLMLSEGCVISVNAGTASAVDCVLTGTLTA